MDMDRKENLLFRVSELEKLAENSFSKIASCVGVIKVMLDEEHFFPDEILREIKSVEHLLNRA